MFNLHVHNFRSFQHQDFKFSKVNLLIGTNSSGKSSLLKFLRMLKQSAAVNTDVNLVIKGSEIDLVNYKRIIYNNDTSLPLEFTFTNGQDSYDWYAQMVREKTVIKESLMPLKNSTTKASIGLTKDFASPKHIDWQIENSYVGTMSIKINEDQSPIYFGKKSTCTIYLDLNQTHFPNTTTFTFENIEYDKEFFLFRPSLVDLMKQCMEKYPNIANLPKLCSFMIFAQANMYLNLMKIQYMNPLDSEPRETYNKRDDKGAFAAIRNIEDLVNILADDTIEGKEDIINNWKKMIQNYGFAEDVRIEKSNNIDAMQLQVQLNKGGIWHNITEVGYGVALHIPILLQTLISDLKGGEILLLEQPEIHIHPRLHAKLLETLVKAGEKNTYIIETHSADMVRELQVLVKQGVLQPEDVTVHYFTREATQTKVVLHSLDKDGIFDIDIPEDFYENYYDLAMKLAE